MLKKSLATYEHGNNISRIEHNNKKNAKQYSCIKQELNWEIAHCAQHHCY